MTVRRDSGPTIWYLCQIKWAPTYPKYMISHKCFDVIRLFRKNNVVPVITWILGVYVFSETFLFYFEVVSVERVFMYFDNMFTRFVMQIYNPHLYKSEWGCNAGSRHNGEVNRIVNIFSPYQKIILLSGISWYISQKPIFQKGCCNTHQRPSIATKHLWEIR